MANQETARQETADQGALTALADPTRRAIFERLAEGPSAVRDLAQTVPVSRPAVSQHLRVLKDAGLVSSRGEGTRQIYRVEPDGLRGLQDYLGRFWNTALTSYKQRAERPQEDLP